MAWLRLPRIDWRVAPNRRSTSGDCKDAFHTKLKAYLCKNLIFILYAASVLQPFITLAFESQHPRQLVNFLIDIIDRKYHRSAIESTNNLPGNFFPVNFGLSFIKIVNKSKSKPCIENYWSTPFASNPTKFVNIFPCNFPDSNFKTLREFRFETIRDVRVKNVV